MADTTRRRVIALALFALWLGVVLCAAWNHAVWRDEVRALSRALDGEDVWRMLQWMRREGHPALWYLLLRTADALMPRPQVLPVAALLVASASALSFCCVRPFIGC